MHAGLDLRDLGGELSYRRLSVFLAGSRRDSAFLRARDGEAAEWSLTDHLLALVADQLAIANWQRTGDAKNPAPKPIPRPGIVTQVEETHYGNTIVSLEEARRRWPIGGE